MRVSLLLIAALVLTSCADPLTRARHDAGYQSVCVESHVGMVFMPVSTGKTVMMMPQYQSICDRREWQCVEAPCPPLPMAIANEGYRTQRGA